MLQLGIRGLGIARFKFNPISWFLKGEPGAWYDPSDLTTLFQDSAGITPVTTVEQPVGLMLDKSKGLALGAELVTNGDFSNGTAGWSGWTAAGAVVNGELVYTNAPNANASGIYQTTPSYSGGVYKITLTVKSISSGAITVTLGIGLPTSSNCFNITSAGTYSFTQTNNSVDAYLRVYPIGTSTTATIDNISVKKIAGNHAFQATAGNRPVLSARVNLLTYSQDFSNAVWSVLQSSIVSSATVAPDGTQTAQKFIGNASANLHGTNLSFTPVIGSYTKSIYAKASGYNWLLIQIVCGGINVSYSFNLSSGSIGTAYNITGTSTATITSVGNGWYRCTLTGTTTTVATGNVRYWVQASDTNNYISGDGTSGIYIWGADLRPTNSGALLPPYQRVNTNSDYDTVGFPLYLKCNGTSSAMSTNSIDFTGTDKMTVVTGVRKLSDATAAILFELSVVSPNNKGFYVAAPQANLTANYSYLSAGTIAYEAIASPFVAPTPNVVTGQSSISTPSSTIRVNSNQAAISSSTLGTGNFGNSPLYLFARAGISLYLNGQFYGAIIRGAQSDTASVTQTENYMATKTGITF